MDLEIGSTFRIVSPYSCSLDLALAETRCVLLSNNLCLKDLEYSRGYLHAFL